MGGGGAACVLWPIAALGPQDCSVLIEMNGGQDLHVSVLHALIQMFLQKSRTAAPELLFHYLEETKEFFSFNTSTSGCFHSACVVTNNNKNSNNVDTFVSSVSISVRLQNEKFMSKTIKTFFFK